MEKHYKNVVLPNFLIVGAAKAGTTSIYKYINNHPQIFMSKVKEPCFMVYADEEPTFTKGRSDFFVNKYEDYINLFKGTDNYKIYGEASTPYLYFYNQTITNLKKYIPEYRKIRILIVLRNPIDRAFSQFMMNKRDMTEDLSFEEAIDKEDERKRLNYHFDYFYVDRGLYYEQVKAFLKNFEHVKVLLYEDLQENAEDVVKGIYSFLELEEGINDKEYVKYNVSGSPKIKLVNRFLQEKSKIKDIMKKILPQEVRTNLRHLIYRYNLKKDVMSKKTRERLKETYRNDVELLSELIRRDLSDWLK